MSLTTKGNTKRYVFLPFNYSIMLRLEILSRYKLSEHNSIQ